MPQDGKKKPFDPESQVFLEHWLRLDDLSNERRDRGLEPFEETIARWMSPRTIVRDRRGPQPMMEVGDEIAEPTHVRPDDHEARTWEAMTGRYLSVQKAYQQRRRHLLVRIGLSRYINNVSKAPCSALWAADNLLDTREAYRLGNPKEDDEISGFHTRAVAAVKNEVQDAIEEKCVPPRMRPMKRKGL